MDIRIERAKKADAEEIIALQKNVFSANGEAYRHSLSVPPLEQTVEDLRGKFDRKTILKATTPEGRIIGSIRGYRSYDGKTAYLEKLMVHPSHQNKGVGTRLFNALEDNYRGRIEKFRNSTDASSERNIRLYEKLGYHVYKTRPAPEGIKYVFMEKDA